MGQDSAELCSLWSIEESFIMPFQFKWWGTKSSVQKYIEKLIRRPVGQSKWISSKAEVYWVQNSPFVFPCWAIMDNSNKKDCIIKMTTWPIQTADASNKSSKLNDHIAAHTSRSVNGFQNHYKSLFKNNDILW